MPKSIYYTQDVTEIIQTNDGFRIVLTEEFFDIYGKLLEVMPMGMTEYANGDAFYTARTEKGDVEFRVPADCTLLAVCMELPEDITAGTVLAVFMGRLATTCGLMSAREFRIWAKEQISRDSTTKIENKECD